MRKAYEWHMNGQEATGNFRRLSGAEGESVWNPNEMDPMRRIQWEISGLKHQMDDRDSCKALL
jgi:hypothetical protein